jgi:hypothetical protein
VGATLFVCAPMRLLAVEDFVFFAASVFNDVDLYYASLAKFKISENMLYIGYSVQYNAYVLK